MQLTISIASFNTSDLLKRCLASIYKFTKDISFEVIVVDNASTDGSAAMVAKEFPQVRLIKNRANRWYTGANNQALRRARGRHFLILNSDMFLKGNSFKIMVEYLDKNPETGAIEPRQYYEDGRLAQTSSLHNRPGWDLLELTLLHKWLKALPNFRMQGVSRRKTFTAEVISDGAMMLRTEDFKKTGGYDEAMKLYYTENDLCRRLQGLSLKVVHLGKAAVWHRVSASTDKAGWKIISKIYAADAKAYYLKYHGRRAAWLLFGAMKLSNFIVGGKDHWGWLSLVILATVLRFYRLPELMTFIGDQGRDYLAARDMLLTGVWPLTGIPSSIPWLHQGPLFIWATALMLKLGYFHPVAPAILSAVLGVLAVYLLYCLSRSWWAGLILATAPLAVIHGRMPYHLSPIPLAAVGYLWALTKNSAGGAVFFASLLLQFELSNLPLLFLTVWWFRKRLFNLLKWSPLGLIPFTPKIIYDFSHGWSQTVGLAAWTGYRLLHLGEYGNATARIFEFWTKFSVWGYPAVAAVLGLWLLLTLCRQLRPAALTLIFMLAGFYVHGQPSEGYFLVLLPVWALLLARLPKPVILVLVLINGINLLWNNFYTYGQTLSERLMLVRLLPEKFKLVDHPQNPGWASYLDNYRYLIWRQGKDYAAPGPVYSVYDGEGGEFIQEMGTTVYHFPDGQKLIKYD